MVLEGPTHGPHPFPRLRHRLEDWRTPGALSQKIQHDIHFVDDAICSIAISLVDHEDIGYFHDTRLHDLDVVPHAGDQQKAYRIGNLHDIYLGLPHSHRLDEHHVLAAGVEDQGGLVGGLTQPPQRPPASHAPDEDRRIQGVALHAEPVAQDGPPREGTGGIHRHHSHGSPLLLEAHDQLVREGAFPRPGAPGDAHDVGPPRVGIDGTHDAIGRRGLTFHQRDKPSHGPQIARQGSLHRSAHIRFAPFFKGPRAGPPCQIPRASRESSPARSGSPHPRRSKASPRWGTPKAGHPPAGEPGSPTKP
ncbi:MAG: hypothetical protein BWY88_00713 [Synergistetes bacterium ADurb.Bin520]|nr:MAG: hypothetical protein BWY88_00713 [Synergistetes bacterium ADurb.Bin520]